LRDFGSFKSRSEFSHFFYLGAVFVSSVFYFLYAIAKRYSEAGEERIDFRAWGKRELHRSIRRTYFGLAERASSFIGPIVWGLVVSNLVSLGSDRYRIAILAVTAFIVLGFLALSRIKDDRIERKREI